MRSRYILILFLFFILGPMRAVKFIPDLNAALYTSMTAGRPMLIYLSLFCEIGSSLNRQFRREFRDFKGVHLAVANINTHYHYITTTHKWKLGTMLLAYRGKIIASSEDALITPYRFNEIRKWAIKALREHRLSFTYSRRDDGFYPAGTVAESSYRGIAAGKVDDFKFQSLKTKYDAVYTGKKSRILPGEYLYIGGNDRTQVFIQDLYTSKPFTLAFNFKRIRKAKFLNDGVLFHTFNRDFRILTFNGRLIVNLNIMRRVNGRLITHDAMYQFSEIEVQHGQWYNLIVSFVPRDRVVRVMLNGKRLLDIKADKDLIQLLLNHRPGQSVGGIPTFMRGFRFTSLGAVGNFEGYINRIVFYNRGLNTREMGELYTAMRTDSSMKK